MERKRLLYGLVAVFAGIAVLEVALGLVYNLVFLAVAVPFAASAYLIWYHASGRMARNTRRQARRRQSRRGRATGGTGSGAGGGASGRATGSTRRPDTAAYRALDLEPGADDEAVRRAYREKVKEVHPDREGGDEEAFKRVTEAYERLTDAN